MIRFAPLIGLALLAACHKPARDEAGPSNAIAADRHDLAVQLAGEPTELADLRKRCRADRAVVGADTCEAVARATRLRFMREAPTAYAPGVVSGDTGGVPSNTGE